MIFLSYAEEDSAAAAEVVAALRRHKVDVYDWQEVRGVRVSAQMEDKLQRASAYLALMSPDFMASSWCRRERGLALSRDNDLPDHDPEWPFIYVLKVAEVPFRDAGFLGDYDWFDRVALENLAAKLAGLKARQPPAPMAREGPHADPPTTPSTSVFQDRRDDLERVSRGLASLGGAHFWLVIGPPQLGKSWFLDEISKKLDEPSEDDATRRWTARLADMREFPRERRGDVGLILAQLFGHSMPVATDADGLARIAGEIIEGGHPHLCLLDSAELLDRASARMLRDCLGRIYEDVGAWGDARIKLAVIVASRRDDDWCGVTPVPSLESLPLAEFSPIVIGDALGRLAEEMRRPRLSSFEQARHARLVHDLSEGLPALVVRCLEWIRDVKWVRPDRLAESATFAKLAHPYVEKGLLSQDSLMPGISDGRQHQMQALEDAFRVLVTYRLFTQSHLRHHLNTDEDFSRAMARSGWELTEVWQAISATALLKRPLNEAWQELDKTVRRLLFRYFYRSDAARIAAHERARKYVEQWVGGQTGAVQVIGLIESLWHQAEALRIAGSAQMARLLCASAGAMFSSLQPSAFTERELRDFAGRRLREDGELEAALAGCDGLHDKLIEIAEAGQEP